MKILLSAFGPFKNFDSNPSEEILKLLIELLRHHLTEIEFHAHVLGVSYSSVDRFLHDQSETYDFIFHMGVATNNDKIRIEFWPKNYTKGTDVENVSKDGLIDANKEGFISAEQSIIEKSLAFIKKSLWLKASYNAGNYLCNYIFYKSTIKFQNSKVLFLHVSDYVNNEQSPDKSIQAAELFKFIVHLIKEKKGKD